MSWLMELIREDSVTHAILVLSAVASIGLVIGSIRIFGVSVGVAGVLFTGLVFGHFQITPNPGVIEFAREFGLVLFVYTIGTQVGPGFFSSLRKHGLPLNLMAAAIVGLGMLVTIILARLSGLEMPVALGLFSGATTSTPSLGAAQQAIQELAHLPPNAAQLPALGYAVTYPFGILGIIFTMISVKLLFRIQLENELQTFSRLIEKGPSELSTLNLEVQNPNLEGLPLKAIPGLRESGVLISRIRHGERVEVAQSDTRIHRGDIMLAVGSQAGLEKIRIAVGSPSSVDLRRIPSHITSRRIVVTRHQVVGKTPRELDLFRRYGVTLTRVIRAEIEFTPTADFELQFGDRVVAVGDADGLRKVEHELGNSLKTLDHPQVIPIFTGILIGVVAGAIPLAFPGAPAPVKLGLAGGPLITAIILSRIGHFRSLVWYMPASANFMLRELGILLFLSCVGLKAGGHFVETLVHGKGLRWIAFGILITLIPILLVAFYARFVRKMNYLTLCGLLAGSMTDTPALAYANSITGSDAPSISYATVYPLTMLMRVLGAQILVILLA